MSKLLLISNLLLGEKTVRRAEGAAPNSFGKSGETAWAALCAAHSLVGSQPLSSILVRRRGFEPPRDYSRYHLKVVRLPIPPPAHRDLRNITKIMIYFNPIKNPPYSGGFFIFIRFLFLLLPLPHPPLFLLTGSLLYASFSSVFLSLLQPCLLCNRAYSF